MTSRAYYSKSNICQSESPRPGVPRARSPLHVGHGQWRLAPAFDLNPFPDRVPELKTWISPRAGPAASLAALRSEAPYFRIKPAQREAIIGEVAAAVAEWRRQGALIGMTRVELDAFADAFA